MMITFLTNYSQPQLPRQVKGAAAGSTPEGRARLRLAIWTGRPGGGSSRQHGVGRDWSRLGLGSGV